MHVYCASTVVLQPVFLLPDSINDYMTLASSEAAASSPPLRVDFEASAGVCLASFSALATEKVKTMKPSDTVQFHLSLKDSE